MKKSVVFLLLIALFFCGCDAGYNSTSAGTSEYDDALAVLQNGVPYISGVDLRLDTIELMETDSYGRRLFSYSLALCQTDVLLIVQQSKKPLTYYYEDLCYCISKDGKPFTEEETARLKEQNHWDQRMQEDKMRAVNFENMSAGEENIEEYLAVCEQIKETLKQREPMWDWDNGKVQANGLEIYPGYGQVMLVTCSFPKMQTSYYLVLYNDKVVAAEPAVYTNTLSNQICEFKNNFCKGSNMF